MGYLFCMNCCGYYSLKDGESLNDFQSCRCGGELTYADSLTDIAMIYDGNEPFICPSCRGENIGGSRYCEGCGHDLLSAKNPFKTKKLDRNMYKNPFSEQKKIPYGAIRLVGIIVGVVIVLGAVFLIIQSKSYLFYILMLCGGLIVSLIAGGDYREGALMDFLQGSLAHHWHYFILFHPFRIAY